MILAESASGFVGSDVSYGFHPHHSGVGAERIPLTKASTGMRIEVDRMVAELVCCE